MCKQEAGILLVNACCFGLGEGQRSEMDILGLKNLIRWFQVTQHGESRRGPFFLSKHGSQSSCGTLQIDDFHLFINSIYKYLLNNYSMIVSVFAAGNVKMNKTHFLL